MQRKSIAISFIILLLCIFINSNALAGYYEDACKNFNFKKYNEARELFLKDIEINDNGNSYYFLGQIEQAEGNLEKAEEYYNLCITKNIIKKYKKMAYWDLIILQEQQGRYKDMVAQCKKFWEDMEEEGAKKKVETVINKLLWTNNEEAKNNYKIGIENKRNGLLEKAKDNFHDALRIDRNFLAAKFEIALIYLENDNANYALQYLRDISDRIPFYGEVHLLLGDIYFNNQSYDYSAYYLDKALEYGFLDKKIKYLTLLKSATSNYETNKYEKALEDLSAATELNKKAIEPLLVLSAIYIKTGNYQNALDNLLKARAMKKDDTEIIYQIGSIYYKTEDQQFIKYFNLLFNKISKSNKSVPQKYYKAFILLLKKQYENEKYQDTYKIIEYLPEKLITYDIHLIAARSLFHSGKFDKAIGHFEKISLENDDRYLLSISYAKNNMTDKAKDILWNLSEINGYLEKAKSENAIKKIAFDIENEKKRIEEERIKELERQAQKEMQETQSTEKNTTTEDGVQTKKNTVEKPETEHEETQIKPETVPEEPVLNDTNTDNIIQSGEGNTDSANTH